MDHSQQPEQDQLNRLILEALAPIKINSAQHAAMRQDLLGRVAESIAKQADLFTIRAGKGLWQSVSAGVRVKQLWSGPEGRSVLVEFAPGSSLLAHRHQWLEEGIVLKGDLQMDELQLGPLDYHVTLPGSRHSAIHSSRGALAYLRGTSLGDKTAVLLEAVGGLLPFGKQQSHTIFANANEGWLPAGNGIMRKKLWGDGTRSSYFYRMQAGAQLPRHGHALEEECMVLDGEVFLGDTLLCTGDYQLATPGTWHDEVYSDVGVTLFVRGACDD
ncbi:cupin domain-containing protein [Methylomonas paludis]|uniref:Cupin domain-containing protein n=1 Tax=Methylomonas paludis TaxID=1173101 RepID=A0A975MPX3_9GAMM|nr:cupin domain-containing protein [Methylomonas paludis]QWF71812.1 cupin domain-containing protein [Methylomonas paludis]